MRYDKIERLALEMGAQPGTVDKWRRRGVPASWQIKMIRQAATQGIEIVLEDFNFAREKTHTAG